MASQVFLRPDRIIWMFLLELQAIKLLHWKIDNGLHKQSDEWRKNIHKKLRLICMIYSTIKTNTM